MNRRWVARGSTLLALLALYGSSACGDGSAPGDVPASAGAIGTRGGGAGGSAASDASGTGGSSIASGASGEDEPGARASAGAGAGDVSASAGTGGAVTTVTTGPPEPATGAECLGTRIDTDRHSASCGACEHACPALELATGLDWPTGLALDATTAYWITSGAEGVLMSAPLDASGPAVVLGSTQGWPMDLEVDATHVYWASDSLFKMPLAGGAATRLVPTSVQVRAQTLVVDATHVYWGDMGEGDGSSGAIMKVPLDGGMPVTLANVVGGTPYGIAVDARSVYWANGADAGDRQVMKAPLDGGAPVTLAIGTGSVVGFAIDATHAYWTSYDTVVSPLGELGASTVMRVLLEGGAPTTLASGTLQPMALAIDGARAYWTNASNSQTFFGTPGTDGSVMGVPLVGGAAITLGPNQPEPAAVATNGSSVCWTNLGAGRGGGSVTCLGVCDSGACR